MLFERFPHLMISLILATLASVILIGLLAWGSVCKTWLFNPFDKVRFDSFFAASDSLMREWAAIQRVLSRPRCKTFHESSVELFKQFDIPCLFWYLS